MRFGSAESVLVVKSSLCEGISTGTAASTTCSFITCVLTTCMSTCFTGEDLLMSTCFTGGDSPKVYLFHRGKLIWDPRICG